LKAARSATSVLPYPTSPEQTIHGSGTFHIALHLVGGAPLIWGVLIKESGFQLALPRCIGGEREAPRDLPPGVEVEQLQRHLTDRGTRLVALPLPCRAAQPVQPGRGCVAVLRRPVWLELIQPVQGHVQSRPALVLDHRHLERPPLRADGDRLHATIDADAVIEMDHVVPRLERARRRTDARLAITPLPAQPAGTAENLVVGEYPQAGQHESTIQRPHREGRPIARQQLLEALELALVVAQDDGRRLGRDDAAQPLDVAVDGLGRSDRKPHTRLGRVERQSRELRHLSAPPGRVDEQHLSLRRILPQPPRYLEMVRRLGPCPIHLSTERRLLLQDEERVARQQVQKRGPHPSPFPLPPSLGSHRQNRRPLDRLARALRIQIEAPDRSHVISPPLETRRSRHPEPVHVQDPAAHAELRHFSHGRNPLVPHVREASHDVAQRRSSPVPLPRRQHQPHVAECRRHTGPLGGRPRGRHEHADLS